MEVKKVGQDKEMRGDDKEEKEEKEEEEEEKEMTRRFFL